MNCKTRLPALSACSALIIAAACSTSSPDTGGVARGDAAADVVARFREEAVNTDVAIGRAIAGMDEVPRSIALDARPALTKFSLALAELDERSGALLTASQEMRSEVDKYLDLREKESRNLADPELRTSSNDRRREVEESMDSIDLALRQALPPLREQRSQLHDVLTFMSNDLTPRGLAAVKEAREKARENGAKVQCLLITVVQQAELVTLGISPARR